MKIKFALPILAAFSLLPRLSAADSIGNKYSCTGTKIKTAGKVVTSKAAKNALKSQITSIKSQIKNTTPNSPKRTKLTNKLNSLKETQASVKSCAAGTFVPLVIRDIAVSYTNGTWNNTTFNSSGGISANMSLTDATLAVSINIGGSMFGTLTPGPVEFQTNVGGITLPYSFTAIGTTIGDLDITISKTGGLQIEETAVPSVPSILRATLTAAFANGAYSGTFESFVMGGTKLAEGTIALAP